MLIDMSDWLAQERKAPKEEGATVDAPAPPPPERAKVEMQEQPYTACQHKVMSIDDKQRTVKCGDCKMWLDPVWCLRELFRYYEQRVDWRVKAIKDFEDKQKASEERRKQRKRQPRAARAETMQHHLERAAWNEYQAKVLAARAARQRLEAEKIERGLEAESEGADRG